MGGAAHLHRYIHDTNQRILWLAREVLIYGWEVNSLQQALSFIIQVAESAYQLNNFNTVFQVVEALKLPAIKRLSAWETLSETKVELFESLCTFCDSSQNFATYRQHLRSLGSQARIPYLPLLLKDIVFLEMSQPWKVPVSGGENSCMLVDLQKMETLFKVLCREVFSLQSPFITSFYTSRLLCQLHLQQPNMASAGNTHMTRQRRGRTSRIDSRNQNSDAYTEEFLVNGSKQAATTTTSSGEHFPSVDHQSFSVHGEHDDGDDDDEYEEDGDKDEGDTFTFQRKYVMIYMSLNNGAMEETFFNNCCLDSSLAMDRLNGSIPMPTSQFLTLTSYLPVPLFSLKMKKQLQGQERGLDMKIQQQMTHDVKTRLMNSTPNDRRRISIGDEEKTTSNSKNNKISPLKMKKKTSNINTVLYPEPLATVPHNMSIVSQDAVQSYAQCIDEELFTTSAHKDITSQVHFDSGNEDRLESSPKSKTSFALFGSQCREGQRPQLQGNMVENMTLTAYDRKVLALYSDTARYVVFDAMNSIISIFLSLLLFIDGHFLGCFLYSRDSIISSRSICACVLLYSTDMDLLKLWDWSKIINEDEKSRLLGGLDQVGLA